MRLPSFLLFAAVSSTQGFRCPTTSVVSRVVVAAAPTVKSEDSAALPVAERIASSKAILYRAVETKKVASDDVVGALLSLEKAARERAREDPKSSEEMARMLDGSWRLAFTTGTIDTQKRTGRINYFPIKAVQTFDFEQMRISNGIFLGDFAALQFSGLFDFDLKSRKLTFDFDRIELFNAGLGFDLGQGGAASIGAKTGLGSKNNEQLAKQGKKPFFNWIEADDSIACARGGGGGLAIWSRV